MYTSWLTKLSELLTMARYQMIFSVLLTRTRSNALLVHARTGSERKSHGFTFDAKEHRSCVDGRATTRHLHGTTERAARCGTVKVPAESADAVSR